MEKLERYSVNRDKYLNDRVIVMDSARYDKWEFRAYRTSSPRRDSIVQWLEGKVGPRIILFYFSELGECKIIPLTRNMNYDDFFNVFNGSHPDLLLLLREKMNERFSKKLCKEIELRGFFENSMYTLHTSNATLKLNTGKLLPELSVAFSVETSRIGDISIRNIENISDEVFLSSFKTKRNPLFKYFILTYDENLNPTIVDLMKTMSYEDYMLALGNASENFKREIYPNFENMFTKKLKLALGKGGYWG